MQDSGQDLEFRVFPKILQPDTQGSLCKAQYWFSCPVVESDCRTVCLCKLLPKWCLCRVSHVKVARYFSHQYMHPCEPLYAASSRAGALEFRFVARIICLGLVEPVSRAPHAE